ncbi:transcription termination factor NusA [Candidatus Epulonipiscioides gigas]|nr:transcription termination factor NusA [Epulopiscium sp. SCG-C07WGA-EpuloA2]
MNKEFMAAIDQIVESKGIDRAKLYEAIVQSIEAACKKHYGNLGEGKQIIKVNINEKTGVVKVFSTREVVDDLEVENKILQIGLTDAREITKNTSIGDMVDVEITPKDFGRIAAKNAKNVVLNKIKEAERQMVYDKYIKSVGDIVRGDLSRQDKNGYIVQLEFAEASLPMTEAIINESFTGNAYGDRKKAFYVLDVKDFNQNEQKGVKVKWEPQIVVSRTRPELVKKLFEKEVVEIHDGTVEIKNVAREAGSRTKIAVYSNNPNVDPVGSCVGERGYRINSVVEELNGEKIDVVQWSEDLIEFIKKALSPADVIDVIIGEKDTREGTKKNAIVVVPDDVLSLAIGIKGQNVRLAAKLTGCWLDIKSASSMKPVVPEIAPDIEEDIDIEIKENIAEDIDMEIKENIAEDIDMEIKENIAEEIDMEKTYVNEINTY